jgi:thiosulfate dehydrogenase [quinone] large subunit
MLRAVMHLVADTANYSGVKTLFWDGPDWLAIMRIGLGLWWFESWRHKDKKAWLQRGAGIAWAKEFADKHRWGVVRNSFNKFVAPHPKEMAYLVVFAELAIALGLITGFLTPIAAAGALLLNLQYFIVMIHDWAERGQNLMMILLSALVIFMQANQAWSIDSWLGILGG